MKNFTSIRLSERSTALSLLVAAAGVVIEILSGAKYPPVPPVFFILLIPMLLILVFRTWWTASIAIIAGGFLFQGLFASGSYIRLYHPNTVGDTIGLWIQTLGVIMVIIFAIKDLVQYAVRHKNV